MAEFKIERIQIARDSASDWATNNPTLKSGEFGYEEDTGKLKIGDGSTTWNSLGYIDTGGGSGGGLTQEEIQDLVNSLIVAGSGISKIYNDASNNLTITLTDEVFTSSEKTKLSNIEDGAEVNRTNTEIVSSIDTELGNTSWKNPLTQEEVQDFMSSALTGGSQTNITVTYDDVNNTFDFFASGGSSSGGLTQEEIEDLVAGFIINGTGIAKVYDDITGQLTLSLSNEIYTTGEKNKLATIESGATSDQTPSEIKIAYENNADTNAFTDALLNKLNGIENNATADQNLSEVLTIGTDAGANRITNLADPINAQDAATRAFVLSNGGGSITYNGDVINNSFKESFTGDGSTTQFTVSQNEYRTGSTLVFAGGQLQTVTVDYNETTPNSGIITFATAPENTQEIVVYYEIGTEGVNGEANTVSNLGVGEGIFTTKSGVNLPFKSLVAGTNVTLSSDSTTITIDAAGGSGETNTASNLGAGEGLFTTKSGVDLPFKSLVAGSNISLSSDANTVTITGTGGSFDVTTDKILDNSTNASPLLGQAWTLTANPYSAEFQGLNAAYNLNLDFNGSTRTYTWSPTSFRAGTTNTVDLGTASFAFKDAYFDGVVNAGGGSSTDWNLNTTNYRKTTTTTTLSAIPEASINDGDLVTVTLTTDIYVYDAGAGTGDIAPDDQTGGTGFWINKTASSGLDTNANLYLSSTTGTSHQLGTEWVFGGNDYSTWLSGLNGSAYWQVNLNGNTRALIMGTTALRPDVASVMDLGSITFPFDQGYFSGQLSASSFDAGGTSSEFLKADGSTDSNSYLTAPNVSQLGISFSTTLAHGNSTVNYTSGSDLAYTIEPNSTVAHPVGTRILLNNENTGGSGVTITAGSGVTLVGGTAALTTGQAAWIIQVTTDEWLIININ